MAREDYQSSLKGLLKTYTGYSKLCLYYMRFTGISNDLSPTDG